MIKKAATRQIRNRLQITFQKENDSFQASANFPLKMHKKAVLA